MSGAGLATAHRTAPSLQTISQFVNNAVAKPGKYIAVCGCAMLQVLTPSVPQSSNEDVIVRAIAAGPNNNHRSLSQDAKQFVP
jgi:hypothetical protein